MAIGFTVPRLGYALAFTATPPTANYKTAVGVFVLVNVGEILNCIVIDL